VVLVDSLIPEYGGNLFNTRGIEDRVTVNIADVRDQYSMNYLVKGQDIMFNLAGTLSHVDSMKDPQTDLEINCRSQLSILESCRNHNREVKVLFAGTRGQYGRAQYLPVDENHPMRPTDVNGINNIAGEGYHLLYNAIYGIRATSLRLTNTYGPRHQMHHSRQGVINWFVRQAIEGKEITIYGDGKQIRDTNYVDDVVNAFLLAGLNDGVNGEAFNLGGEPVNLVDLVALIVGLTGGQASYRCIPFPESARAIEIGDYVADWSKARAALGWHPSTPLADGMERTIAYYREHGSHYW
jgi:UDP-glucose 4-epimerase